MTFAQTSNIRFTCASNVILIDSSLAVLISLQSESLRFGLSRAMWDNILPLAQGWLTKFHSCFLNRGQNVIKYTRRPKRVIY